MNSLVCDNLIIHSNSLFHFHSFPLKNRIPLHFSRKNWISIPQTTPTISSSSSSFKTSSSATNTSYGGWESEHRLGDDSDRSGESTQLRNFLVSLGIDDRKYVFVFLLGIVCALAVARVRVSTIVMFPASVIVFAVGFSIGFVRRGSVSEIIVSPSKRSGKDETFRVCFKKLRNLLDFFDDFDSKLDNLNNHVKSDVYYDQIAVGDMENYVKVIDSMRESASRGKIVVEGCIECIGVLGNLGDPNGELVENQKSSRRRKEVGEIGFDLSQFLVGLFGVNFGGLKPNKSKGNIERDAIELTTNNKTEGNKLAPAVEEFLDFVSDNNKPVMNQAKVDKLGDATRNIKIVPENGKLDLVDIDRSTERLYKNEQYSYQNRRFQQMNDHHFSLNKGRRNATETWASYDSSLDSVNFSVSLRRTESGASFHQEQILRKSSEAYLPSQSRETNETYRSNVREEREFLEDLSDRHLTQGENGYSSSSMLSDDVLFDRYLTEATGLLKQARESLRSGWDEDRAEVTLYKSAELLSKAIAMKPMSLLAVGQLGNTYLLHGELKLKISRELRSLLTGSNPLSFEKWANVLKGLGDHVSSKDKIPSLLVNVCEECEELLVEAGKKYRMALSIDGNDTRALYNWGLALSFRAQLIADIGPKAAIDADKVFLAAIDKFDAMMSKGNIHTSDALFRWGVALQQRSRLRPHKSKEKVKLLQQAKQLYEDALDIDSDNLQVREALSSCISELNLRHF